MYRIGKERHADDLSGEGARLFGGRWNLKGTACLYTSSSRALCLLEYTVNVRSNDVPTELAIVTIEIPDMIKYVEAGEMPADWQVYPAPSSTKLFGKILFQDEDYGLFSLPSSVVPEERNILINVRHKIIRDCNILEIKKFAFDKRIKT